MHSFSKWENAGVNYCVYLYIYTCIWKVEFSTGYIRSHGSDSYVGMMQVQNGILYIAYRGGGTGEKHGKKPLD